MPDFDIIEQKDFSGGVNIIDDPINLRENEFADARNIRVPTKTVVKQRYGYTQYNSTAIGASTEIRSLYQFEGYDQTLIPVCQASGAAIYKGSAAFPNTGSWSSIFTETASADPASFCDQWGKLIICNNVDAPIIWEGNYGICRGFKQTIDNATSYYDLLHLVNDKDTTTNADVGALDTVANGDWLLIRSHVPKLTGFRFTVDTTNKNTAVMAMAIHYWDGDSWEAVSGLSDGTRDTATTTKTLNQTGNATFTEATTTAQAIDNCLGYWWRISITGATVLSSSVQIIAIELMYNPQVMQNIWAAEEYLRPLGFKSSSDTSVTMKDWTTKVVDNSLSTFATLGALTVTTGAVYVQSIKKFRAIKVTMSTTNINTNAVTMTATYWDGDSWAALTISDGTSANSKTLAQSGIITFTWPTAFKKHRLSVDEEPSYQVQLLFSAALSTDVDVAEIELIEQVDALRPHKYCIFHKNRLFLANRADTPNYLYFSAAFAPDVMNGSDAGYIGLPSGRQITAICHFFNELFIATPDEIYLLEGSTPLTFGLLKVNTGGVGVSAPKSVIAVGKFVYFMHSTGFYRFDGVGVTNLSNDKIGKFFDVAETSYFIPSTRYIDVQGRFNRYDNTVEWTVSKGSTQTTNNLIIIFDVLTESFFFDDIVAASFVKTVDSNYADLVYHGDYTGKVHRDMYGTTDNGVAVTAYFYTKGFGEQEKKGEKTVFRGVKLLVDTEASGTATIGYAMSGATSYTSLSSTVSYVKAGVSSVWHDLFTSVNGSSVQISFTNSTSGVLFTLHNLQVLFDRGRRVEVSS